MRPSPFRRRPSRTESQASNFRQAVRLEALEQRNLMAVVSRLTAGVLDITFDADKDSAQVSAAERVVQVIVDGRATEFAASEIRSIQARSLSGSNQSLQFDGTLLLPGDLSARGIAEVVFASGAYSVGTTSVVTPGSIEFNAFQLDAAGAVELTALQTVTSAETGLLGFLGVVAQANNTITVHDSVITGTGITLVAHTEINATANGDNQEDVNRDFARVKTVSHAAITIDGTSSLQSKAALSLLAESLQTVNATALARPTSTNAARDAALALTNVTSTATIDIRGEVALQSEGNYSAKANNVVTVTTLADGSLAGGGGKGGVLALAEFLGTTTVVVAGTVTITAPNVELKAESSATETTTAKSTVGGATANDLSTTSEISSQSPTTASGGVGLAAAYARTKSTRTTQVTLSDKTSIRATGQVNVLSDASGNVSTNADATNTNNAGTASDGFGIAIAIEKANHVNRVGVDGSLTSSSNQLTLSSQTARGDLHTTTATSGSGAANVGAAGSFARARVESTNEALLNDLASLDAGGAAVAISATGSPALRTEAKPAGTTSVTAKKGVGASVAQNKLLNTTSARIGSSATLANASALTIKADETDTVTTLATTGAEGGSAFTPGVATTVVDSNVSATLADGAITTVTGSVNVLSNHLGNINTTVSGDVLAEKTAVGGSFALNDVDVTSKATIMRSLTATGDVNVQSSTGGAARVDAKASANGTGPATKTSDQQTLEEQAAAGSDDSAPSADAKGKVTAGAATAINLVDVSSTASTELEPIISAGALASITAINSIDATAKADASAVGGGTTTDGTTTGGTERGLAVAIAINRANAHGNATIDNRSNVRGENGLNITATTNTTTDTGHIFSADAVSGAGGRQTGVAGSFALNKVGNNSKASVTDFALANIGKGALGLRSQNTAINTASATPLTPTTGGEHGVGASFALNIADNQSTAQLSTGAHLIGFPGSTGPEAIISAVSNQTATTTATGGTGSESSPGQKALTPVFAIQAIHNVTSAPAVGEIRDLAGNVQVNADATIVNNLNAEGTTVAEKAARGIVLALDMGENETFATIGDDVSLQSLSLKSQANVTQNVNAKASSKGGDTTPIVGGTNKETADAKQLGISAGASDNGKQSPDQQTPEGSLALAGAIAVGLTRTETLALVHAGANVDARGAITIDAHGQNRSTVKADATALTVAAANTEATGTNPDTEPPTNDKSGRGVGVAIAVNANENLSQAAIESTVHSKSIGLSLNAGTLTGGPSSFSTEAVSGAGGGKIGAAGSLAIQVVRNTSDAHIGAVSLDASTGSINILSNNESTSSVKASPSSNVTGSQRGRGAAVAINSTHNTTTATLDDNALVRQTDSLTGPGATNLNVKATSNNTTNTEALGGAGSDNDVGEKAATAVFSLARVINTTTASASSSEVGQSIVSGSINVEATHNGVTNTKAEGSARAEKTSVGIVLGLGFVDDNTTAVINDQWKAGGDINVTASDASQSNVNSKASARGGEADKRNALGQGQVDVKVSESKNVLEETDGQAIDKEVPAAKTPDASLALAGALAVNVGSAKTVAKVGSTARLEAVGAMRVQSLAGANVSSVADASAVVIPTNENNDVQSSSDNNTAPPTRPDPSQTGVGVAIDINVAKIDTSAIVEGTSTIKATTLQVDAGTALAGDKDSLFRAESIAGAGVDKVGFAGALTVNVVANDVVARVGTNASIELTPSTDPDLVGRSQDLSITSRNEASSVAVATASVVGSPTTGVGPAIVVNVSQNSSAADLGGALLPSPIRNLTVDGKGDFNSLTHASSGSTAQATVSGDGGIAVSPALAVSVNDNDTTATSAENNLFNPVNVTGNLVVQANHKSLVGGTAEALVNASGKGAVGTPVVVNVDLEKSLATTKGDFTVTGNADVLATSDILTGGDASASVMGSRAGRGEAGTLQDRAQEWAGGFRRTPGEPREKILDRFEDRMTELGDVLDKLANGQAETVGVAASVVGNVVISHTEANVDGTLNATGDVHVIAQGDRDVAADASSLAVSPAFSDAISGALALNIAEQSIVARAQSDNALTGNSITLRASGLASDSQLMHARALAGGGAVENGRAGSIGINIVQDNVQALLGQSTIPDADLTMFVNAPAGLVVDAKSQLEVQNVAGAAGIGLQTEGSGGALSLNALNVTTEALSGPTTTIHAGGVARFSADSSIAPTKGGLVGDPIALAAAGAGAGDQARAGAVAANLINEVTRAEVGADNTMVIVPHENPRASIPGDLKVTANSETELRTGAGAIALTKGLGQGIGIDANVVNKNVTARMAEGTQVNAAGAVDVHADSAQDIFSIAAAPSVGGSTGKPTFGGAVQVTSQVVNTLAEIDDNAATISGGNTSVVANHSVDIEAIGGALGVNFNNAAIAGSLSITSLLDRTEARVGTGATVTSAGTQGITVEATSHESVLPISIGGSAGGGNASAGSLTLTRIHQTTLAHVDENAVVTAHNASGLTSPSVKINAVDTTLLKSGAGALTGSGSRGFGGSLDATKIEKSTHAFAAGGAHLEADRDISISANSSEDVVSLAGSVGVASGTSILGAMSGYSLDVTTEAVLGDNPLDLLEPTAPGVAHARGSVVVTADEKSELDFIDGAVGLSASSAVGGAANLSVVKKNTRALIAPTAQVDADALEAIDPISLPNGKFNVSFPVAGFNADRVAVPALTSVDSDGDHVGELTDSSITRTRVVVPQVESKRGVLVSAINRDDLAAYVAGGGGSAGGFAIGISTPAAIVRSETVANIGHDAQINTHNSAIAGGNQSVTVTAGSDYSHLGLSGALAVGSVGIAPAANIESTRLNTFASIGENADVVAERDVNVQANATEDSLLITASGSFTGGLGANGSLSVFGLDNQTHAFIAAGADVDAGGNVVVSAADVTDLDAIAGAAAFSTGAGFSLSFDINVIHKDTQAFIANAATVDAAANSSAVTVIQDVATNSLSTTTARGVIVQAYSKETLLDVAASGAGSAGFSGAGSAAINVIDSDTSAFIGDSAVVNTNPARANPFQSVQVLAGNEVDARSISGGVAIGSGALAGSADIGVVRNDTTAFIGSNANVKAKDDIVVNSLAREDIDSLAISGGFSLSGSFAAAVAVWAVGTKFDPTYSDDATTANSLAQGTSSVDSQVADSGGKSSSILQTVLGNFSHVNDTTVAANPTPEEQAASILREGRQSLAQDSKSSTQITTELFDNQSAGGTVAAVHAGALLTAGDDVVINAKTDVELTSNVGSLAAATAVAAGASINVGRVHMKTDALLEGTVVSADVVNVTATFDNDTLARSFSGQGAIVGALGAAVTAIRDESSTTARIDGSATTDARVDQASTLNVRANSSTNLESHAGQGAAALAGAAGLTISRTTADGNTSALVGDHVRIGMTEGQTVSNMNVEADANNHLEAHGTALAAGIGAAGTLNFSKAEITATTDAALGNRDVASQSAIKVAGNVNVLADSTDMAAAEMRGLLLAGGAALGIGRATAIVSPEVEAAIGKQVSVNSAALSVLAGNHHGTYNDHGQILSAGAITFAESAAGAAVAINNAQARSTTSPIVDANVYDNSSIETTGTVRVEAQADNMSEATGGGLTVGLLGVGGVETTSLISGIAQAGLRTGTNINAGSLIVHSNSIDRSVAEGRAAAGGLLASGGVLNPNGTSASSSVRQGTRSAGSRGAGGLPITLSSPNSSVNVIGATIDVTGGVSLVANQQVDADAFAKGLAIAAGLAAGQSQADVTVRPKQAVLAQDSSIQAGGSVMIQTNFGDGTSPSVTAVDIGEAQALANDEISVAFAKGSGGALVGLIGSTANTIYKPISDAKVNRSTIDASTVMISADDDSGAAAIARNFSAGLVARGTANATLDMKDDLSAGVDGSSETQTSVINAINTVTVRVDSSQDGDAFSNTRAIAGFPTGRATTLIQGDYDLSATIGDFVDIHAGSSILIDSQVDKAEFGFQLTNDPEDEFNVFGRPNFIGANANSDTGGISADAFATATTRLGRTDAASQSLVALGAFSRLQAPTVTMTSDVSSVQLKSDASARSGGAFIDVSALATGEVHTNTLLTLHSDSNIDATSVVLEALNGSSANGIQSEVEATTDKDGLDRNPVATGTTRMDTTSTIIANDRAKIATRNLTVRADTNVSQFDLKVLENNTPRANAGTRISSFERDRTINWNADVVLKGAASPTLIVEANGATGATVTQATGITIQDTDASGLNNGTVGNVAAPNIVVNSINNTQGYGNVLFEIPRRGAAADDTGVIDGGLGSFTVLRGFDEVNIVNHSNKPLIVGAINVLNMSTPNIVVDAPDSSVLSFPVFHNFGDTHVNITSNNKSGIAPVTLNGVINNPVGETFVTSSQSILRTGAGKIVSNVVDLDANNGSVGTSTNRIPIELVISGGRQEDLRVEASTVAMLDLTARQRENANGQPLSIDVASIKAGSTADVRLHTSLNETTLPTILPQLRVNEIQENDITFVISFFETVEQIFVLDLGALAENPTATESTWNVGLIQGVAINLALDTTQITGPLVHINASTDVGTNTINASTNGSINLTETNGTMRVGLITTTRGNVTLNSAGAIAALPIDAATDVVGTVVNLNAATTIGAIGAAIDVDSTSQLNANSAGNIVLTETTGNANVGLISASNGTVTFTALAGSILDAQADAAADVVGNAIALTAENATNTIAPTIGTSTNALEIDSAFGAAGSVRALATGDVYLVESAGPLSLTETRSAVGNIRVDVPDTSSVGSDLNLVNAQVIAPLGSVQLNAGDNFTSSAASVVQGLSVAVVGDFGNADVGVGSTINVGGSFSGRPVTFSTGNDIDSINLQQAAFQGPVSVNASGGNDAIQVDRIAPLTTTTGGVRDTLTLNVGTGNNSVVATPTTTGNFIANVVGDRGSFNTFQMNGTTGGDLIALNSAQIAAVHPGATPTSELYQLGDVIDRLFVFPDAGNDTLSIDLTGGNLAYTNTVNFNGGSGADQITVTGSASADTFEVDATSANSGVLRTQVGTGPISQPINLTSVEQVSINGQNPTTSPGDTLKIIDSVATVPVVPNGSVVTPLPVAYTNIERVLIGSQPNAAEDRILTQEDTFGSVNPFANDTGLSDLPLTVSIVQPTSGSVVYNNNATPLDLSDDRLVYTPPANFAGTTSFQYTVRDVNGESSTATVTVVVSAVVDVPRISARDASGSEGTSIAVPVTAELADVDGSESLIMTISGVPAIAFFVNSANQAVGESSGDGTWRFTAAQLSDLFIVVRDNGNFTLTAQAIATETSTGASASASASFVLAIGNTAPQATIMEAPASAQVDQSIAVRMAAVDPSSIDQGAGFLYRVNWGDGSAIESVQGQPGVGPTLHHTYTQRGLFTIRVTATDKDGGQGAESTRAIRVSYTGLVDDPLNPGQQMLVIDGTDADDSIQVLQREHGRAEQLDVIRNGRLEASYPEELSRIAIYGHAGNDSLYVSSEVEVNAWLFGGDGDDTLYGSGAQSILVGNDGNDALRGRGDEDILIGGRGADVLFGGDDDDLLLAGYSHFDEDEAALLDIQREWTSNGSIQRRIDHLRGAETGGLNQATYLLGSGKSPTAFDDDAVDLLLNDRSKDWVLANSDTGSRDRFNSAKYFEELGAASADGEAASFLLSIERADASADAHEKFLLDVNGDGQVTPIDALLVIGRLQPAAAVPAETELTSSVEDNLMLDVSHDGHVSPMDALHIINRLNKSRNT